MKKGIVTRKSIIKSHIDELLENFSIDEIAEVVDSMRSCKKWIKRSKVKKMIKEIEKKPLNDESTVWVVDVVDIIEKYLKENEE